MMLLLRELQHLQVVLDFRMEPLILQVFKQLNIVLITEQHGELVRHQAFLQQVLIMYVEDL